MPAISPDFPARTRRNDAATLALLAVCALAMLGWWALRGRPVALAETPGGQVECVSYAPFRQPGESPLDPTARVDEARIRTDLQILSERTRCVRTYSVAQGLDAVPRIARALGMEVLLGAWIGRDRDENERELALAIGLARANPDVVRALIVGNEVLLRRELPETELAGYLARARGSVPVPVTYADVWEFWFAHPRLAESVSFVTIHILPYWEDEPVGVERSLAHVLDVHAAAQKTFAGKEVLIGETGWPAIGKARRDAEPGRVEQARFAREFVAAARERGIRYNLIEGFDQPWKRRLEGAMGGGWGLFDSEGRARFPWNGPVQADPRWTDGPVAAAIGALAFVALAAARGRRARALLAQALAGAAAGAVLAAQWRYMVDWNRDAIEWTASGAYALLALLLAWLATDRAVVDGARGAALGLPGAVQAIARIRARGRRLPDAVAALALLRFVFLFGAATMTLLLVFDARYRGYPWPLYAIPAAASVLLMLAGERAPADAREERLLAAVIVPGSVLAAALEWPQAAQAWAYFVSVLLLAAWPLAPGSRRAAVAPGSLHAATAPSSAPTADGSKQ